MRGQEVRPLRRLPGQRSRPRRVRLPGVLRRDPGLLPRRRLADLPPGGRGGRGGRGGPGLRHGRTDLQFRVSAQDPGVPEAAVRHRR